MTREEPGTASVTETGVTTVTHLKPKASSLIPTVTSPIPAVT